MNYIKYVMIICGYLFMSNLYAEEQWDPKFYNPKPAADDVVLPMPCGGSLVFKKIATNTVKPLDDMTIILGNQAAERGAIESPIKSYIAGSFIDEKSTNKNKYYLMAKYEITELQYNTIMQQQCPTPSIKLRRPKTNVSWFDAIEFNNKYSQWLLSNAKNKLPTDGSIYGYVRLPTNEEWEYAARGGNKVSESEFRQKVFPFATDKKLKNYAWYASTESSNGHLNVSGLLDPNPVGLYDILGNASEMVFDNFRLNKLDRYHGQAGAISIRGGSYLTSEDLISTGFREEKFFYDSNMDGSVFKAADIGFRIVMVTPILTSSNKYKEINTEWNNLGIDSQGDSHGGNQNLVGKLDTITNNVADEKLKNELEVLNKELRKANAQREEQMNNAIKANLKLGSFLCINLAELNQKYLAAHKSITAREEYCSNKDNDTSESDVCSKDIIKAQKIILKELMSEVDYVVKYYADTIVNTTNYYDLKSIQSQLTEVENEMNNVNKKNNSPSYLKLYTQHLEQYYKDSNIKTKTFNKKGEPEKNNWLYQCSTL